MDSEKTDLPEPEQPERDDLDWLRAAFDRANNPEQTEPTTEQTSEDTPSDRHEVTEPITGVFEFSAEVESGEAWWTAPKTERPVPELDPILTREPEVEPAVDNSSLFPPTEHIDVIDMPDSSETEPEISESAAFATEPEPIFKHENPFDTAGMFFDLPLLKPQVEELPNPGKQTRVKAANTKTPRTGSGKARLVVSAILMGLILTGGGFAGGAALGKLLHQPNTTELSKYDPKPKGEWGWFELNGGECFSKYESAWQASYKVVSCGEKHAAELVYAGNLAADSGSTSYPGDEAVVTLTMERCSRKDIVSLSAASTVTDLVIDVSYPENKAAWDSGITGYYCFATSASGSLPNASIAGKELTKLKVTN